MTASINNRHTHILLASFVCCIIAAVWIFIPHPVVVIALSILPIAILITLKQPFLMVLLFVIFSFFRIHEVFPQIYNFKIPLLLSLASLTALFWHVAISQKITPYWSPELTAISIFFILVIIGVIIASNRPIAITYFKGIYWKIIIMTYAISWLSRQARDFSIASTLITFFGLLVGLVALSNKINGIGLVEGTRVTIGRAIGSVLGDPNDLALVLMFPVAFAVSLMMTPGMRRSLKIMAAVSLVTLISAIIATQSRGGLLGILSILGVVGYRHIKNKTLFFTLGIIFSLIMYYAAGVSDRASGGATEEGIDASAMGRLYAWGAAFGMALHNPLTGVGINNFYSNYFFYSSHWDGINHAVHSTWFGVLAETGFLGLIVFITVIIMLIRTSLVSLNKITCNIDRVHPAIHATALAVFSGLIGTIVSGTFLTQGFTWPIYILAALIIAVSHWINMNLKEDK